MKHLELILIFSASVCFSAAKAQFLDVKNPEVRKDLETQWIFNKAMELTGYYPPHTTLAKAREVLAVQKIKQENVIEILYYSLPNGRHILFIKTDQRDGSARFHCIGFDDKEEVKVFWTQFQPNREKTIIEVLQIPEVEKTNQGSQSE
jgi:hypothetical protein